MEDELFFGLMFIVATIYMLRKSRDMSWRTKADAAVLELGQRAGLAHSTHDADQAPSLLGGRSRVRSSPARVARVVGIRHVQLTSFTVPGTLIRSRSPRRSW